MTGVLMTTKAFIAAFTLAASLPADGQSTPAQAVASVGGKSLGSLKVEEGSILIKHGNGPWNNVGQANIGIAVKALTELYPDVTFVADPHVLDKPVTDFIDRSDDAMTDLKALRVASGGVFDIRSENNSLITLEPNSTTFAPPGLEGLAPAPEEKADECFNLTGYLGTITAKSEEERYNKIDQGHGPITGHCFSDHRKF